MKSEIVVSAEPRDTRGKNEARRLRAKGLAPAVIYGAGSDPLALAVNPKEVAKILHSGTGSNTIFNLDVNGASSPVMIVDWQFDPVKNNLLHVDLKRIDMTKRITVKVPVVTSGVPRGVKEQGGLLELVTREVEIECLPADIPAQYSVDVTDLTIGQNYRANQLQLGSLAKLVSSPDAVIAHVVALRAEETTEAAGAPAAGAIVAEPEVIKKGKKQEEGAADDKAKKK